MATYAVDTDGGASYSSLSAAEAALPGTPTEIDTITLEASSGTADTTAVTINNDRSTFTLNIVPATGQEHPGYWDDTIYTHETSGNYRNNITIDTEYVSIVGMQIKVSNGTGSRGVYCSTAASTSSQVDVSKNIIHITGTGNIGVEFTGDVNTEISNNIIYGGFGTGIFVRYIGNTANLIVINNTVVDSATNYNFGGGGGTVVISNNIAQGGTTDYSWGTFSHSNCIDEDGTGDITSTLTFTDAVNYDYSLDSTDTDAIDAGSDQSTYIADDTIGTSRPQGTSWDIGAFEYIQSTGSVGASVGTSTALGTGSSTASATGSSTGLAVVSGVGSSTVASAASSDGVAVVSGVGSSAIAGDGSSAGSSTSAAIGESLSSQIGSSSGSSVVSGVGESSADAAASSSGLAVVSGIGDSTAEADGSSSGLATVAGVGESVLPGEAVGSSSGTSTAAATGAPTFSAAGSSAGLAVVSGVGSSTGTIEAVGSASGTAAATGIAEAPEVRGGGIGKRRKHRQFANIDGKLVEVSSFKEAEKLINHFNKGRNKTVKPKKRRITFGRGPYVSVYDADHLPQKEIKEQLNIFYDDEEMLLLLLMAA